MEKGTERLRYPQGVFAWTREFECHIDDLQRFKLKQLREVLSEVNSGTLRQSPRKALALWCGAVFLYCRTVVLHPRILWSRPKPI
jgi:hypothetical protein